MANSIRLPEAPDTKVRRYASLAGVDFSNNPSMVALNRSPDAKNVYKNYRDTMGQAIETRPGISCLGNVGEKIYGLHILGTKCLIHYGTTLSWWETFPNEIADESDLTVLNAELPMNETDSVSFVFGGRLYIMDGTHYYVYNGTNLADVCDDVFIPTTRIGADPDGGNAMTYQGVNLLGPKRKNSFVGDGTSTTYYLDTTSIDANCTPLVWKNGEPVTTGISLNDSEGTVSITPAPGPPSTPGTDNVVIQFQTEGDYSDRIKKCTIARVFDNRVFVSGNPDYAGRLFHSELNDPTYFADTSYYTDGDDGADIKTLIQGQGMLIAVKENRGNGSKVYLHTPSLVYTDASDANSEVKAYPRTETEIMLGCNSDGINFMDDIVFLSPMGLEGIRISEDSSLEHRSTLIDTKFISESYFEKSKMEIWNNYLMVLVNGKMYLADSRQKYAGANCMEYEWYFWDNIGIWKNQPIPVLDQACILKEYEGGLYFGTESGYLGFFSGNTDSFSLDAADPDYVLTATNLTDSIQTLVPVNYLENLRTLSVKGNVESVTGSVVITGTNGLDKIITETITVGGSSTVNGNQLFKTVTSIQLPVKNEIAEEAISVGITNDVLTDSYWTTPPDYLDASSHFKNIKKKGAVAEIKRMSNAAIKIDIKTDKNEFTNIFEAYTTNCFTFVEFSFLGLQFGTDIKSLIVFKPNRKKIKYSILKFYSDLIKKPFGFYNASIEVEIQKYIRG